MGAWPNALGLHGAVVAVTVLVSFSSFFAVSAQEASETDDFENSGSPAEASSTASGHHSPASKLAIGIGPNDPFPFGGVGGSGNDGDADEVLFEDSWATDRFSCRGHDALAVERANVAVRRLAVWVKKESSFLGGLGFGDQDAGKKALVWVTDGQLRVFSEEGTGSSTVLLAELESPLPNGTRIEAGEDNERTRDLAVMYDCRQEGRAIVELRLRVESTDGSTGSVCLKWVKQCTMGWKNLKIEQGDATVLVDGQIQDDWLQRMTNEGTHDSVAKFVLSAEGIEQIRRPVAVSNQKLVSVELLGPLAFGEKSEVSREPTSLTVKFDCLFDGFADITVLIEKDSFSGEAPERLTLKFRKVCGTSAYKHLEVNIKSDKFKNKTMAVSEGLALPGFARPCKGAESQAMAHALRHYQDLGDHCDNSPPVLMIPDKELRTVLELDIDKWGSIDPPTFSPQADVTYDSKVLTVRVLQAPFMSHTKAGKGTIKSRKQTLTLKYTCYKDAESIVMVTLHVIGYKSINVAWRKQCMEPKAKVGKALTAPQAMLITMFVCGIIVLIACMIFMFGGGKEKEEPPPKKHLGSYKRAAVKDSHHIDSGDIEMEYSKPNVVGVQEVTFHS